MSSTILITIENQLSFYGYPIVMFLGNIGNIFIVILLLQQRQKACLIYLISSAIVNGVYITFDGFIQIFPYDYHDETILAITLCKITGYIPTVLGQVAKTMIVLACIDRFMITSDCAVFRSFSTPKRAKWLVFFSIVFWLFVTIHLLIMRIVVNGQCGIFNDLYSTILSIYILISVALIPSGTMGIFGYLTSRNIRKIRVRIRPVTHYTSGRNIVIRRRDRHLLIIVISEVFVYVITTAPYSLILLESMISQYTITNKSVLYLQIEGFILSIAYLFLYTNSATAFYIYLISSKQFRRDFRQLFMSCYRKLRRHPLILPVPIVDE